MPPAAAPTAEPEPKPSLKLILLSKSVLLKALVIKVAKAVLMALEKSGLYLFMAILPIVIVGYPAYLIATKLIESEASTLVEATLTGIDITKVQDSSGFAMFKSKGHTEVTLSFKGADGRSFNTVIEKPWMAPGLRKQMEEQYGERESFTLYLSKDGQVRIDEQVAGDRMTLLSMLMALVLFATVLFIFLRHRLADRMPDLVSHESAANARSIIYAQLTALVAAFMLTVVMHFTPVVVSNLIYLGAYWGVVVLVGLSLRLLVFQPPPPPPEPEEDSRDRDRRR